MFNGKDLSGWVNVNCAPGTFFVKGDEIITTGKPTGFLRTAKQYENFIAEFDWMHVNKKDVGNSGFFVWADPIPAIGTGYTRGIEVQVLVNLEKPGYYTSQGDLFSIWGATCKPDRPHPHGWARCLPNENRCKGGGEWNHYKVVANNGTIKLHVNGKEVSGVSECKPRKGYLALESEGAECHFKNLTIQELPSTDPKPEEVADIDRGYKNLYTGLDLSGWKSEGEEAKKHWQPRDWVLHTDGKGKWLATEKELGDGSFIADFRFPKKSRGICTFYLGNKEVGMFVGVRATGVLDYVVDRVTPEITKSFPVTLPAGLLKPAGEWNRLQVSVKGKNLEIAVNGKGVAKDTLKFAPGTGPFRIWPADEMDFANLFVKEDK
jgi:hypothetical protein